MTRFATPSALTTDLADRIADALRSRYPEASVTTGLSNQSASAYVEFSTAAMGDTHCIRISDHEARSYNRDGDFRIGIGAGRDDHVVISLTKHYSRTIVAATAWDDDGEAIEYETVGEEECGEDGDDAEFSHWSADETEIEATVAAALAFAEARA